MINLIHKIPILNSVFIIVVTLRVTEILIKGSIKYLNANTILNPQVEFKN
jgi:hypothetical protein